MSLNKTLDRLFDEIRREARRNPDFAHRIDAVLRGHSSRRDVPDAVLQEEAQARAATISPVETQEQPSAPAKKPPKKAVGEPQPAVQKPQLNPVGLYQREGEDALVAALDKQDREELLALVAEHNLDPGGEAGELDRDALAAHVIAQAKRRAERDRKLFDY